MGISCALGPPAIRPLGGLASSNSSAKVHLSRLRRQPARHVGLCLGRAQSDERRWTHTVSNEKRLPADCDPCGMLPTKLRDLWAVADKGRPLCVVARLPRGQVHPQCADHGGDSGWKSGRHDDAARLEPRGMHGRLRSVS